MRFELNPQFKASPSRYKKNAERLLGAVNG
jgi:hypothetical protein